VRIQCSLSSPCVNLNVHLTWHSVHMLGIGLTGGVGRFDQSELSCCSCSVCEVVCMHSSRGSCIGSGGVQGGSLWFSNFGLVVCALCLSIILSRMCRAIALAYGVRDISSSSDLAFCLLLAFDRLLVFLLFVFSFLFLLVYYMCVLLMHSRARLRTMCGSRADGWLLPGAMSD
jgi:hypothetical protein